MCGLVGQLGQVSLDPAAWLASAVEALRHRGPDDGGTWSDPGQQIWLGHRRLSVIDLSDAAHQPLTSAGGRIVVAFNGEIYNHGSIAAELRDAGVPFKSSSDTEVVANAIEHWGMMAATERFIGMFALAVWDRTTATLHLARDRIGEKPLYVQHLPSGLRFASELKALSAGGAPVPPVNDEALSTYLRLGYIPAPASIFEGVTKVPPGEVATFAVRDRKVVEVGNRCYWSVPPFADGGPGSIDDLEERLRSSVALQLHADVPVGAFLSGGIDSSLVVALASEMTDSLKTFTIGFEDARFDESTFASLVSQHLGTDHTMMRVTARDALDIVPRLPDIYDEPFADHSAIPTRLLAGLAREQVTVALTGDGGDELFCGYDRYRWLERTSRLGHLPAWSGALLRSVAQPASDWSPKVRKLERLGCAVELVGAGGIYKGMVSNIARPVDLVGHRKELHTAIDDVHGYGHEVMRSAMGADLRTYLPDDILVKVDRASMDVSLEVRVPMLDPNVVAWSRDHPVPTRGGTTPKWPLREILLRRVPSEFIDRPKMGFGVPVGSWLRGPLRAWADFLLDPQVITQDGLLNPKPIRDMWSAHQRGRVDLSFPLWTVLMFQAWRQRWS